jgi:hypothetical protein
LGNLFLSDLQSPSRRISYLSLKAQKGDGIAPRDNVQQTAL